MVTGFLVSGARIRVAEGLVIAALALLLVYGADAGAAATMTSQFGVPQDRGFIPIDPMTRAVLFGGVAASLSTAAFFVSWNKKSIFIPALLVANGILATVVGMVPILESSALGQEMATMSGASPYIGLGLGLWIAALGIAKFVMQAKAMGIKTKGQTATS